MFVREIASVAVDDWGDDVAADVPTSLFHLNDREQSKKLRCVLNKGPAVCAFIVHYLVFTIQLSKEPYDFLPHGVILRITSHDLSTSKERINCPCPQVSYHSFSTLSGRLDQLCEP